MDAGLLDDVAREHVDLVALVADLDGDGWGRMTPAEPWTIADQICHLAFFDEKAALAAADPGAFLADLDDIAAIGIERFLADHLDRGRAMTTAELLSWSRTARRQLVAALAPVPDDTRLPWYGPPMRAASSAVARLMETWAHGQDVADALGVRRTPTERLFRIADLGVRTFRFGFENRGLSAPDARVRVELHGPGNRTETWNPEAADSVIGPVEDFCLVVAQRRNIADTDLVVNGEVARHWMQIAQVFAGPPGPGREPTGRPVPRQPPPDAL